MIIDAPRDAHIPSLRSLFEEAFGDTDAFLDIFFSTAFSPNRCRCVTENGRVLAALYWFDCYCHGARMAYLYAVATSVSHRGQGLFTALMEDTHKHLASRGYAGAILVPGEASLFSFYEKSGYVVCGGVKEFSCAASEKSVTLYPIDTEKYANLRREYLPEGGVIQEGENLNFLAKQASLYMGDRFLLAARREGDILCVLELMGDLQNAPAIVRALGCALGHFRTVGDQKPFAMYRPLVDPPLPAPVYFGLAFD